MLVGKHILEPYVVKVTRTVLKRVRRSNPPILSDSARKQFLNLIDYKVNSVILSKNPIKKDSKQRKDVYHI